MQKISTYISAFLLLSAWSLEAKAQVNVASQDLEACFGQTERLSRLACYDALLQRPQTIESSVVVAPENAKAVPQALVFARDLLMRGESIGGGVSLSLWDAKTGVLSRDFEDTEVNEDRTLQSFLSKPRNTEEAEALTAEYDVYLALKSDVAIGEAATLIVACKNNITRLSLTFETPFDGKFANARFYGEEEGIEQSGAKWRKMWVRGEGYTLENARGLDSIRLLQHISTGDLGQVSMNQGDTLRSAFFEVPALKAALPYTAFHCSWSNHASPAD